MPSPSTWVAALLLALLAAATLAQRFADARSGRLRALRVLASSTLHGGLVRSLLALTIVPALVLTLVAADKQARDHLARDSALVRDSASNGAAQVDAFLERHAAGVRGAAQSIALDGATSPHRLGEWLLRYHPIHPDFRTMLVAGPDGAILAGTARESGRAVVVETDRRRVDDRGYYAEPMRTGRDYVSDGFRGRGFGSDPLVAISSVVTVQGRRWGVVEGSLDLNAFARLDRSLQRLSGAHLVVVDAKGAVLYASAASGLRFLDAIAGTPFEAAARAPQPVEIRPVGQGTQLAAHATTALGWRVFVTKPVATRWDLIAEVWWVSATWLALCIAIAGALAWALARRTARPVRRLVDALAGYEFGRRSPFASLDGLPREYEFVFRRLHAFVIRLARGHRRLAQALERSRALETELRAVVADRDREIEAATEQLAVANAELAGRNRSLELSEAHFRALAECASVGIVVFGRDGRCSYANSEWCRIAALTPVACAGDGWSRVLPAGAVDALLAAAAGDRPDATTPLFAVETGRSGRRWVQARCAGMNTQLYGDTLIATFEDVTELVHSRQTIRDLAQRLESVREDERTSLSQTLHEGIAQDVFAAKLELGQALRSIPSGSPAREPATAVDAMLATIMQQLRDVTVELRPAGLERLSLTEVVRGHAERFAAAAGLVVAVHETVESGARPADVPEDARVVLFRAVQEALTNVARHARATRVDVTIRWTADAVTVEVNDDGAGASERDLRKPGSFGLVGLRERLGRFGGTVELRRLSTGGSVFVARLPVRVQERERTARIATG